MLDYSQLSASDGTGEAVLANIESDRAIGSITIDVDSVENFPNDFIFATGTKNANNFITPASMTVGYGHIDAGNVIIDGFAPGYVDDGNTAGQVLIIKPTTHWVDEVVRLARVSHNDDGSIKEEAVLDSLDAEKGVYGGSEYFTASDTFEKDDDLKYVIVEVQAPGGGSGRAGATGSGQASEGSGGGGGEYAKGKLLAADLAASEAVTIGTPGGDGVGTGTTGGTTSFGAHITALGGAGGSGMSATSGNDHFAGGRGGSGGVGGELRVPGGDGGKAAVASGSTLSSGRNPFGGDSFLGSIATPNGSAADSNAVNGKNYGGGAAGPRNGPAVGATKNGGTAGAGIVIVHKYY